MSTFSNISIRNKLILMQVFTSVLVLSIFFAVFVITDINGYKDRKVKSMSGLAQVVGTNSISTLEFHDDQTAKDILSELEKVSPEIIYASIIDAKGQLFASYTKQGADSFRTPAELKVKNAVFSDKLLFVSNPIVNNKEKLGTVYLQVQLLELDQIKQTKYKIAAVLFLIAIAVSFLIAFAVQRYISNRVLNLVHIMNTVSQTGNYNNPITDDGKDEIGVLIKGFNNLMQQVEENERRKDEFIGIASHELRTPLTTIKGYMELLHVMDDHTSDKQIIQKALANVNKLERLIKDLLDVSKIQSGQLELNMNEFNVDSLLDETISSVQMVSRTHKIIKDNSLSNQTISADRQRIEQVMINLLSNAVKYSPGQQKVIVHSRKTATDLVIKIRDFGIGVPMDEQSNIFERFYRTKDMSVHISGFGLGLYICRDIIERHNGKIWVETREKGSEFCFTLPLNSHSNGNAVRNI